MIKTFIENIELTPSELEEELWRMDSAEQTIFLFNLMERYAVDTSSVLMQLQAISDYVDTAFNKNQSRRLSDFVHRLVEYFG